MGSQKATKRQPSYIHQGSLFQNFQFHTCFYTIQQYLTNFEAFFKEPKWLYLTIMNFGPLALESGQSPG